MTRTDHYALHGITMAVSSDLPEVADRVASRLAAFAAPPSGAAPELRLDVRIVPDAPTGEPPPGRPVYDPPVGRVTYDDAADVLHLQVGAHVTVVCAPAEGTIRARVAAASAATHAWLVAHPLLTIALVEVLARRGLFTVHAGGVARDGRALLLAGGSGAGKSTLTVALVRAGHALLGDDLTFVRPTGETVEILAFPDEIDLADDAAGFFPELDPVLRAAPLGARGKRALRPATLTGAPVAWRCRPAAVVLPRVSGARASDLRPVDPAEALLELAPNVLLTEPRSTQRHLDALGALVESCPCYRLDTGRDLDGAVGLLGDLLG